ncbi:hypothetical protein NPX13_g10200 [Xylaria arbuscula]|uniref:ATP-dependent DNA helicase n=1 Tax=Xylaria arbuscula TaxID=114810 RepID=A0A9W8N5I1_9PEZI|nr:hypothetical protein NPX13_g10200 [Xylaria arbuscula]
MLSISSLAVRAGAHQAIRPSVLIAAALCSSRYLLNNTRRFSTSPMRSLTSHTKAYAISSKHPFTTPNDLVLHDTIRTKEPTLCPEQAELVDIICSGRNVFYTGSAGCGKSTVLKAFTKRLRDQGLSVDIVAPTGVSALGVGGFTTFVYAGWGVRSFKKSLELIRLDAHDKYVRKRLKNTDICLAFVYLSPLRQAVV